MRSVILCGDPQVLTRKPDGSIDAASLAIATAMAHPGGHLAQDAAIDRPAIEMPCPRDSAHFSAVYCQA
jgi:hypothetical protein